MRFKYGLCYQERTPSTCNVLWINFCISTGCYSFHRSKKSGQIPAAVQKLLLRDASITSSFWAADLINFVKSNEGGAKVTVWFDGLLHCDWAGTHCDQCRLNVKMENVRVSVEVSEFKKGWSPGAEKCIRTREGEWYERMGSWGKIWFVRSAQNGFLNVKAGKTRFGNELALKPLYGLELKIFTFIEFSLQDSRLSFRLPHPRLSKQKVSVKQYFNPPWPTLLFTLAHYQNVNEAQLEKISHFSFNVHLLHTKLHTISGMT